MVTVTRRSTFHWFIKSHRTISIFLIFIFVFSTITYITAFQNHFALNSTSDRATNIRLNVITFSSDTVQPIQIPHSPRYTLLHQKRQKLFAILGDLYPCDYMHIKGQGKSGTTWLKSIVHAIESKLCTQTNYTQSYHYRHSEYAFCKDWTNGSATHSSHCTNYNRHALHDIKEILIDQEQKYANNDTKLSQYFMGFGLYELWKAHHLRYCVFLTFRDPRNRVLSHINTFHKKMNNGSTVDMVTKNELFKQQFNEKFVRDCQTFWDKYTQLEAKKVLDYYLYFYEDLRQHSFELLKNMIWFAGFLPYIDDGMISEIIEETDITRKRSLPIVNEGNVCSFHNEQSLSQETKIYANKLMLETLSQELIDKFNMTCPIYV